MGGIAHRIGPPAGAGPAGAAYGYPVALALLLILPGILLLVALRPVRAWVYWAYNVEQAGRLMALGMAWPDPRPSDALPVAVDEDRLQAALGHLAAAGGWRPDHGYAHRLAGQIHAARQDWLAAVDAQRRAQALAPQDPLVQWEAALVYEAMLLESRAGPELPIAARLAAGTVIAPGQAIDTPFCTGAGPTTCYVGTTVFVQPLAELAAGPSLSAEVLFMHPPAAVTGTILLPDGEPALTFLLGLDPGMVDKGSDGATFHILVEPEGESPIPRYRRTVDGALLAQGWVTDWVDLTPWAGREIRLHLETDSGPQGNSTADWVGWGNLALTDVARAQLAVQVPYIRMQAAWQAAGLDRRQFQWRRDEALNAQQPRRAAVWQRRADLALE